MDQINLDSGVTKTLDHYNNYQDLNPEKWKYYFELSLEDKDEVLNQFDTIHCEKFINKYFKYGGKEKAFDISFLKEYLENGKHKHTVSLYFLGCCFQEIVTENLNKYLKSYISHVNEWYDFRYTWYLTCLYHDIASANEKQEWKRGCPSDLDFYLGKYNIQYNVFEHNWDNPQSKPYTYSENLIKNYFKYRVEYCHSIDHGIIAGFVLYDRLVKNYNHAIKEHCLENQVQNFQHDDFLHKNLNWRKEHISHFAIISDAIIAHNIWLSDPDKVELYKQYGLDPLINDPHSICSSRLTLKNNPLVFFLDLFDTIEPVKFFADDLFPSKDVLKAIKISNNEDRLRIAISTDVPQGIEWCNKLKTMKNWLDVTIQLLEGERHSTGFQLLLN